ncbi:hypothetical protein B4N89_06645 [Embleya scabrispora]|uniref:PPE family domain-containing protein n=1 Tax=Embleya scabrispora TaxID=159449 RepID=A0A1T3NV02_9ACTN|nr:hypothetical protein [Embleya scabrispora]OPC80679.1 hypothetical protein B4N89_06645 [Embleya scabrispora]
MSAGDDVDPFAAIHAARPGLVGAAADGWRLAATRLTELRDELAETARLGTRVWSGGGAERFTARCHALADSADRLAGQGTALHEHLTEAAHALVQAQKSATDPKAAEVAIAQLQDVYRDLGERLPLLPCAPDDGAPSRPTATLTTTAPADAPPPSRPCATTAPPGGDPDPTDSAPTATEAAVADPTPPPTPVDPSTPCAPPPPDTPAAPPPAPPAQPPPSTAPLATCIAATTPPPPPTTPPAPGPPPIACPPQAAMPTPLAPAVVGTPLPRDPRPVQPAGIGPRLRQAAPPPSAPIAPVTGIRIAPGLRGGTGDHPAATHDAAHTADPAPNVLAGTTHTPSTPASPTWMPAPITGGTPTTPVRPRRGNRYASHPAQAWSAPEEPPRNTPESRARPQTRDSAATRETARNGNGRRREQGHGRGQGREPRAKAGARTRTRT